MKITSRRSLPERTGRIDAIGRHVDDRDATRFPFSDFTQLLSKLFTWQASIDTQVLAVGPIRAEVELAADRAEIGLQVVESVSPFAYNVSEILASIGGNKEILYLANPNRIGGATLNLSELEEIVDSCTGSLSIIDEYYFEYFSVTAADIAKRTNNLLVLRSYNAAFDNRAHASGYAIGSAETIEQLGRYLIDSQLSLAAQRTMMAALSDEQFGDALVERTSDEALRITKEFAKLGIQCRLAPTDFILIRVASPDEIVKRLKQRNIPVEHNRHIESLSDYIHYEIQRPETNDRLVDSFLRMPEQLYRMQRPDRRSLALKKTISGRTSSDTVVRVDRDAKESSVR